MASSFKVFLSHTTKDHRDHALAQKIAAELRELGVGVWIAPDNIPVSAEWLPEIVSAILRQCSHFLVIISAASSKSEWVLKEIQLAKERWTVDRAFSILPLIAGQTDVYPGSEFLDQFQQLPYHADVVAQLEAVTQVLNLKLQVPDRKQFEKDVAELFSFFGYDVKPGMKSGGDTVWQAVSPRRNRPNLFVECKLQDRAGKKVEVEVVQRFAALVSTSRMNGVIDQGYLVTNTGFSPDARDCLAGQPQQRYVFLVTYEELLQSLLDAHNYLLDFVSGYEANNKLTKFVDLRGVDMCGFSATAFEAIPGDHLAPAAGSWADFKTEGLVGVVLPSAEVNRLITNGFAFRQAHSGIVSLDSDRILAHIKPQGDPGESSTEDATQRQLHLQQLIHVWTRIGNSLSTEFLHRLGYSSSQDFLADLQIDPERFIARATSSRLPSVEDPTVSSLLRKYRWRRDFRRLIQRAYAGFAESAAHSATHEPTPSPDPLGTYGSILCNLVATHQKAGEAKNGPAFQEVRLLQEMSALRLLHDYVDAPHGNLLVLFGDYGAGKTTVINRFMYDMARRKLDMPYDSSVRLPLLINLRDYNKVPDFTQLLRIFLTDQAEMGDINMRLFKRLNDGGRFVLLLDGFDEMLARVTKPDRRRCFLEIADYVGPRSKVVLTGRPGYFPEHAEFNEVLEAMNRQSGALRERGRILVRLGCLQLMDDDELDNFVRFNSSSSDVRAIHNLFSQQPGVRDLARRPVLAGMILESASELARLGEHTINARRLYELYTGRWVAIEEDKGGFRILIDPDKKATFLRYLAMQMHLSGALSIHYRQLDQRVAAYFGLESSDTIDHFSHDVRTCSFLNRTDAGEYRFIHKSFMEYFAACEYERQDDSPYASAFNKPLTAEMQAFVDTTKLGLNKSQEIAFLTTDVFICIEKLNEAKVLQVAEQDFELAAGVRDIVDNLIKIRETCNVFGTMHRNQLGKVTELIQAAVKRLEDKQRAYLFQVVEETFPDRAKTLFLDPDRKSSPGGARAEKPSSSSP